MDKRQLVKRHVPGRVYIPIFCTFEGTGAAEGGAAGAAYPHLAPRGRSARAAKGIRAKAADAIMETEQARRIGADVTARLRHHPRAASSSKQHHLPAIVLLVYRCVVQFDLFPNNCQKT